MIEIDIEYNHLSAINKIWMLCHLHESYFANCTMGSLSSTRGDHCGRPQILFHDVLSLLARAISCFCFLFFLSKHFLFDELMGRGGGVLVGQLLVARAIYDSSAGPSLARSLGHPLSWLLLSLEQDFSLSLTLLLTKQRNSSSQSNSLDNKTFRVLDGFDSSKRTRDSDVKSHLTAARRTFFWNTRCSRNTGLKILRSFCPFLSNPPRGKVLTLENFARWTCQPFHIWKNGVILHQGWVWTLREGKNLLQVSDWNPMNQIVLQSTAWGLKMHWQCAYWRAGSFKYSTEDISYLNQYTCKIFPNISENAYWKYCDGAEPDSFHLLLF